MQLSAEFTTEPFHGEGDPPAHAVAVRDRLLGLGLTPDFGPLGTSCQGRREDIVHAIASVLDAALDSGAERVTFQVGVHTATTDEP